MGMEQERSGGGAEWRWLGLRKLRVAAWSSAGAHNPERASARPLQGDGDVFAATSVCMCRKASCLGSSHGFRPWCLRKRGKEG